MRPIEGCGLAGGLQRPRRWRPHPDGTDRRQAGPRTSRDVISWTHARTPRPTSARGTAACFVKARGG